MQKHRAIRKNFAGASRSTNASWQCYVLLRKGFGMPGVLLEMAPGNLQKNKTGPFCVKNQISSVFVCTSFARNSQDIRGLPMLHDSAVLCTSFARTSQELRGLHMQHDSAVLCTSFTRTSQGLRGIQLLHDNATCNFACDTDTWNFA